MNRYVPWVFLLTLGAWDPLRSPDPDVAEGNRAYAEGRYDDALAAYDRADDNAGIDREGLAYDRGTALLRKSDGIADAAEKAKVRGRALELLQEAARSKVDPQLRSRANFNRGNAQLADGKLPEAIDAYKQALRDDHGFDDARANLEVALKKRDQQQAKQPPQQGQGPQGQGQQGQGQQGQGQQGQGQQGQGQQQGQQGQGQPASPQPTPPSPGQGGSGGAQPPPSSGTQGGTPPSGQQQPQPDGNPPRGNRGRIEPRSPETPSDQKLDDLENFSRRLQREETRRRASGRSPDPTKDW